MGTTARTSVPGAGSDETAVHRPVSAEPTPARQTPLPGWASVGEALAGQDQHAAPTAAVLDRCRVVGRDLAEVGASVGEGLDGLRSTTLRVRGREPTYEESLAVAEGWGEATLSWVHRLSCAEPLTGLATQAHLHTVVSECYRDGAERLALVVVELPTPEDVLGHTRQVSLVGAAAASAFPDARTVARLGVRRVAVLADRGPLLTERTSLLRRMVEDLPGWVWVEALPHSDRAAAPLLEELAR